MAFLAGEPAWGLTAYKGVSLKPSMKAFLVAVQEAYKLMCQVAPDVAEFEKGIATLQAEIRTRKASIAHKEAALAASNPPLFRQVQVGGAEAAWRACGATNPHLHLFPVRP